MVVCRLSGLSTRCGSVLRRRPAAFAGCRDLGKYAAPLPSPSYHESPAPQSWGKRALSGLGPSSSRRPACTLGGGSKQVRRCILGWAGSGFQHGQQQQQYQRQQRRPLSRERGDDTSWSDDHEDNEHEEEEGEEEEGLDIPPLYQPRQQQRGREGRQGHAPSNQHKQGQGLVKNREALDRGKKTLEDFSQGPPGKLSKPFKAVGREEKEAGRTKMASIKQQSRQGMMEGAFMEIFADEIDKGLASRVLLPGFPIEVTDVVVSIDGIHASVFWCLSDEEMPMDPRLQERLAMITGEAETKNMEEMILQTIQQRLEDKTGWLRARLAERIPGRRVISVRFAHFSKKDKLTKMAWEVRNDPQSTMDMVNMHVEHNLEQKRLEEEEEEEGVEGGEEEEERKEAEKRNMGMGEGGGEAGEELEEKLSSRMRRTSELEGKREEEEKEEEEEDGAEYVSAGLPKALLRGTRKDIIF